MLARGALQLLGLARPVEGHAGGHRHALLGVADRGRQDGLEADPADRVGEVAEGINGPRQGDRFHPVGRHDLLAPVPQIRRIKGGRGPARAVQRPHFLAARQGVEHEAVAADPGHLGFAEAQQYAARDGRVHGVAAALQDVDGHLGRERVGGGTEAVTCKNGGTSG